MLNASYFDGKAAAARPVSLTREGQNLRLRGEDIDTNWPLQAVTISERLGNTPRLLTFAGGGHCEITDHAALDTLLGDIGGDSWLDKLHHSLRWALLSALLIVVGLFAAYRYLLPWGAEVIAQRTPAAILQKMGDSTLETLDHLVLHPSKLDAARQQAILSRFARLGFPPETRLGYRIVFRSAPDIGPNAFALPDGTLVMLDELVNLTRDDDEIIAVLTHERGHVERRHAMRMTLQSSVVGLVIAWYAGDVSALFTSLPAALLEAGYSRGMESEADKYAEQVLRLNALSPCLLTDILDKMESAHRGPPPESEAASTPALAHRALDYLSSHPATGERKSSLCPAK